MLNSLLVSELMKYLNLNCIKLTTKSVTKTKNKHKIEVINCICCLHEASAHHVQGTHKVV